MVEAKIQKGGTRGEKISQSMHDIIIANLGDDDIRATGFHCKDAKIDPLLCFYPGSHHMCITNEDLDKGRGNGTICRCLRVKLKRNDKLVWKNWDGRKVWTTNIDNVKYVEFEHWPNPPKNARRKFRLKPQKFSSAINFPITQDCNIKVGNVCITQIPINANIATTGHKLQGMSKDTLIVNNWNYKCANWVYVVLSRVRTRKGLFLSRQLDISKEFAVPENLKQFEYRMKNDKEKPLLQRIEIQKHNK